MVQLEEYANAQVTAVMSFEAYSELVKFLSETKHEQTPEQQKLFASIQFTRSR